MRPITIDDILAMHALRRAVRGMRRGALARKACADHCRAVRNAWEAAWGPQAFVGRGAMPLHSEARR